MVKRILVALILFLSLSGAPFSVTAAAKQSEPLIRVGILTNQVSILVSADTPFELVDSRGKSVGKFKMQEKVAVSARTAGFAINGALIETASISVQPTADNRDASIEVNKRRYRGDIDIYRTNGKAGLTAVNTLPLEQYLYGIIAKEVLPDWPVEAIKAQAVAARTYALANKNKHQSDRFDVCATTDCQVYGGRDGEVSRASQAVDDTRGIVAMYRGKLIFAYFHSSGGGYTESSENVWGAYLPYLRAVPDFDQKSPRYKWERTYKPEELEQLLRNAGYDIGKLQVFELSKFLKAPVQEQDRGISGRVKSIHITGSQGTVTVSGSRFRTLLGLPSALFDIQTVLPVPNNIEVEITDSYGDRETKKIDINLKPVPEKGRITDKDTIRRITYRPNEVIVINGYGSGHGVGLSQWGAKAMADKAPVNDTEYFKSILKHYYQGIDLQKSY